MRMLICRYAVGLIAAMGLGSAALGGGGLGRGAHPRPTDDFGHDFVKVGRPGNRDALPEERVDNVDWPNLGGVGHRFRVARTEVTATHWLEFVNAYDQYWAAAGGSRLDSHFTSELIRPTNLNPASPPNYQILPGLERSAVTMSWYMAARYCNWLHNDKGANQESFEAGAYDTSTFGVVPGVGYFDQIEHSPGAKFWIPTLDEWTKAAYYDPNRYGDGLEGYWSSVGRQNEQLISGPPGVGETSAGTAFPPGYDYIAIGVGAYSDIQSPWGLLDTSGGVREWTETLDNPYIDPNGAHNPARIYRGSEAGQGDYFDQDIIDDYPFDISNPNLSPAGLRLASAIPGPGTLLVAMVAMMANAGRRERRSPR